MTSQLNITNATVTVTTFLPHTPKTENLGKIEFMQYIKPQFSFCEIINAEWFEQGWEVTVNKQCIVTNSLKNELIKSFSENPSL